MSFGCRFFDKSLFDLFDTPVRHVIGMASRMLHAVVGEYGGGVVRDISNELVGDARMTLFKSDLDMIRSLSGVTGPLPFVSYVIFAGMHGECMMFSDDRLPRLGFSERPFVELHDGISFNLDELEQGLGTALRERESCVGTAVSTVLNMLGVCTGVSAKGVSMIFRLDGLSYTTALADAAAYYGHFCATEFFTHLDADRVLSLLGFGYLLVIPLEKNTPYEVFLGSIEPLPARHLVLCMAYGENFVVADAEGIREMTENQLAELISSAPDPWYDGLVLVGIKRMGDGFGV